MLGSDWTCRSTAWFSLNVRLECSVWFERIIWVLIVFQFSWNAWYVVGHSVQMFGSIQMYGRMLSLVRMSGLSLNIQFSLKGSYVVFIHVWFNLNFWFRLVIRVKGLVQFKCTVSTFSLVRMSGYTLNVWFSLKVQFSLKGSHGMYSCLIQF